MRPRVPWFNVTVKEAKRISRKHERIWRKTRSELDRKRFTKSRNHANHVMEQARRDYYFKFIEENSTDQRRLFKATGALLGNSSGERYPPYKDLSGLANDFGKFFAQKIDNIRFKLDNFEVESPLVSEGEPEYTGSFLTEFQRVSSEEVKETILSFSNKSCASDPIPTDMVKDCIDDLLPAISNMVNSSLVYGYFPDT